ncbi:MAG: aminopeptidase, partial [Erysipelotrichaceae bacterium]|nr:aminopeptidase [Erysipelotrichaceae bacterium]
MKKEVMRAYAQIIVRLGVNVQPGQYVAITVSTAQDEIGVMVAEECYKAGAAHVRFNWTNDDFMRLRYINESIETMSEFTEELKGKYEDELKHPYVGIYIDDSDPDVFNGIDNEKLTEPRRRLYPFIKKYRDELEGKAQWTIVAMPQVSWARKMYPGVSDEEAMEKLEKAIMHTMRMDTEDPVGEWHKHIETLKVKAATMNEHHFKTLHYTAGNGTDFIVDLHPKHVWQTAWEKQRNGISSCVNMPTEEVFTIPEVHSAHGKLVASLPLSYNGNLIEDFSFEFEGGKIVKVDAAKGQEQLEKM